jgi:hypothetical protein
MTSPGHIARGWHCQFSGEMTLSMPLKLVLALSYMQCGRLSRRRGDFMATGEASGGCCHTCWCARWYASTCLVHQLHSKY